MAKPINFELLVFYVLFIDGTYKRNDVVVCFTSVSLSKLQKQKEAYFSFIRIKTYNLYLIIIIFLLKFVYFIFFFIVFQCSVFI